MWEYTKIIPMSVLRRQYPPGVVPHTEVMQLLERDFANECSEVLGKAMKKPKVKITLPYRDELRNEINEWLKM